MGSEFSLRELCDAGALFITDGYRTRRDQLAEEGAPILRVAHVREGFIEVDKTDRISRNLAPRFAKKTSRLDDVVITTKGTVGRTARISEQFAGYVYSPQVCVLRVVNREVMDPAWLYCWARSPEFQGQLDVYSGQTDMAPYVKLKDLLGFGMTVPPIQEQRAIAEVLGALDDRIEWCRSTQRLLRATLHARFQSEFRVGHPVRLGDVTETVPGRSYKSADLDDASQVGLVNLKNIPRHGGFNSTGVKGYTGPYRPQQVVRPGELVVACTDMTQQGDVIGRAGRVRPNSDYPTMVISMDLTTIRPTVPWLSTEFLAEVLSTRDYVHHVKRYVNGTTVLHLKKVALAEYETPLPPPDAIAAFTDFARSMWTRHDAIDDEADVLVRLRNSLLPRLLSGELRIEDPTRLLGVVG